MFRDNISRVNSVDIRTAQQILFRREREEKKKKNENNNSKKIRFVTVSVDVQRNVPFSNGSGTITIVHRGFIFFVLFISMRILFIAMARTVRRFARKRRWGKKIPNEFHKKHDNHDDVTRRAVTIIAYVAKMTRKNYLTSVNDCPVPTENIKRYLGTRVSVVFSGFFIGIFFL